MVGLPFEKCLSDLSVIGRVARRAPRLLAVAVLCAVLISPSLLVFSALLDDGSEVPEGELVARISEGTAPYFVQEPKDPTSTKYNVTVYFTALARDVDNDALNVTWDWGDGRVNVTKTGPAGALTGVVIRLGHAYAPDPEQGRGWDMFPYFEFFNLTIYLDDGHGNNVSCKTQVNVEMPINGLPVIPTIRLNGTTSTALDPAETVYIVANSSDPEGESLTWTYIFRNDAGEIYRTVVLHTPETLENESVWVNVSHTFETVGQHRVDVSVSDALLPYQTFPHNSTNTTSVKVTINLLPNVGNINVNPNAPIVNATLGYVLVNLSIEVSDSQGDPLNVTWDFGDGLPGAWNESANGVQTMFRQVRTYTDAGSFNITVTVTDGKPDHEVYRYKLLNVSSTNLPPVLRIFRSLNLSGGTWAQPNETILFEIVISDPERDEVELTINWGDGSEVLHVFLSDFIGINVTIAVNHTYTTRGNFTIVLNYTDNKIGALNHTKTYVASIETRIPYAMPPDLWSWWDYTTLAVAALLPVGAVMWAVLAARHRRWLENEGLSADEWRLLQDKSVIDAIEQEKKR